MRRSPGPSRGSDPRGRKALWNSTPCGHANYCAPSFVLMRPFEISSCGVSLREMTLRIWRSTFRKTGRFLYSCVVNVARYLELLRQEYPQEIAGKARVVKPAHACVCTDRKAFSDDLRTPGDERARLLRVVGKFTTKRWSIQAILFALASVAAHAVPQSPFSNNVLSKDWLERSAHSSA